MSSLSRDLYRAKFDSIFQQIGKATNSIWKGEKRHPLYIDGLEYETCVFNQKVKIKINFGRKSRTIAIFEIGNKWIDNKNCFTKKIFFSCDKTESKILKDFLERLEVDSLEDKITKLLEKRKEREHNKTMYDLLTITAIQHNQKA